MNIRERLQTTRRIFLDSAPVIYFAERNPHYLARVEVVFDLIDDGTLSAVTSPVTLAECLVHPCRLKQPDLIQTMADLVLRGHETLFVPIGQQAALMAAELRAQHNLSLTDSFQVAIAVMASCSALLTNDVALSRIRQLDVIVLDDYQA